MLPEIYWLRSGKETLYGTSKESKSFELKVVASSHQSHPDYN